MQANRLEFSCCIAPNQPKIRKMSVKKNPKKKEKHLLIWCHCQFFSCCCVFLSSLVTYPRFTPIAILVLKVWQFLMIKYWKKFQKLKIPTSWFCSISGDWGECQSSTDRKLSINLFSRVWRTIYLLGSYWLQKLGMANYVCNGALNGNILVTRKTICGKTIFIQKLFGKLFLIP